MASILPYKINVPDSVLDDLRHRLDIARLPNEVALPIEAKWSYGTPVDVVKDLVEYWKTQFDWRRAEAELNIKLPQFTTLIDTEELGHGPLNIHFAHKRSSHPHAIPLIIVHGWPGNFAEVLKIIDDLTEPKDPKHPAFHVISPSIPGYGFSDASPSPGLGCKHTAHVFDKLMKKLGYNHYLAQGGDWGAFVVRALAIWHQESCRGILSSMLIIPPALLFRHPLMLSKCIMGFLHIPGGYSSESMRSLVKGIKTFLFDESAYYQIQSTKPQTLSFSLTDSPVGLLAWLREKYHTWTDNYAWTNDELLTWVMLYWVPGPAATLRYYKENGSESGTKEIREITGTWSPVPIGVSKWVGESFDWPHDFGSMIQPLKYYKEHSEGGHFGAWERPDLMVTDIREFTKIVVAEDPLLMDRFQPAWSPQLEERELQDMRFNST